MQNHEVVLLPEFRTSQMVVRNARKIRSKTAREMLTWAHYRFRERLLSKVQEWPRCKVWGLTPKYSWVDMLVRLFCAEKTTPPRPAAGVASSTRSSAEPRSSAARIAI